MVTSFRATFWNKTVMFTWALMIAFLVLVGFATLGIGLIFIVPILGHATWHAYRDLIK